MGNKRSRRSRRLETPSPNREEGVETPNPGNMTLTNSNLFDQENLGPNILANQITEPSVISNEIQVWTQEMEKRNNDRIEKMREEIDNKFDAILREIETSKNASTITNPRSESNETQNNQPSGSRNRSIGVRASENENSDSEKEDNHLIRASNMHELRDPARRFCQNRFELDETLVSKEDSEEENYHNFTSNSSNSQVVCKFPLLWMVGANTKVPKYVCFRVFNENLAMRINRLLRLVSGSLF